MVNNNADEAKAFATKHNHSDPMDSLALYLVTDDLDWDWD